MTRRLAVVGLVLMPVCLAVGCSQNTKSLGEPLTISPLKQVEVEQVLADPKAYDGKTIRLAGKIDSVCAQKGCWVRLGDGDQTVFVKFTCPIEGRLVPMEAEGCRAMVEGTFECKEIPEDEARHYLEDSGASADEIAKVRGPQQQLYLFSKGIVIEGLPEPAGA